VYAVPDSDHDAQHLQPFALSPSNSASGRPRSGSAVQLDSSGRLIPSPLHLPAEANPSILRPVHIGVTTVDSSSGRVLEAVGLLQLAAHTGQAAHVLAVDTAWVPRARPVTSSSMQLHAVAGTTASRLSDSVNSDTASGDFARWAVLPQ